MAHNPNMVPLDSGQIVKRVFDGVNDAIRIELGSGTSFAVSLDSSEDSVKIVNDTVGSAAISRVSSSASNVHLLIANASRKGVMLYNESTAVCYVKLGATASATSYSFQMSANSSYVLPTGLVYLGAIDAIWASANGAMMVTEL